MDRNGRFERAFVSVHLNPAIPLYHNVNLTDVGAGLELNPTAFFGSVGVTAMEIYKINGRVAIAFPTKAQPFRLTRDKLDGLTQDDYDRSYTRFTIAAAGEAFLQLPVINQNIKLGSGYFLYQFPGYVHVGGEISEPFGGVFTFSRGARTGSSTSPTASSTSARTSSCASSSGGSAAPSRRGSRVRVSAAASASRCSRSRSRSAPA